MKRSHSALVAVLALVAFGGARFAREAATATRPPDVVEEPYAPTPAAAPIIALGYRELAADLLWVRFLGYFGGEKSTATGITGVVEAIVGLDPGFHRVYEYGARAMTMADIGVDQQIFLRALAVLERGMREFPDDYKLPELASQIYATDLKTSDAAQRRAWDEKSVLLMEAAIRKPGAPVYAARWAAMMRTKLGQREQAIANLREMILLTPDPDSRKGLIDKLSKLVDSDRDELAAELFEQQRLFDAAWERDRPTIPATMYVLLGPRLQPSAFDPGDLATGGRELIGTSEPERLEPVDDDAATSAAGPRSP